MGFGIMDGSGFMSGWGWGGMAFGGIMMVLWVALIIALIVFLFRWISGSSGSPGPDSSPDALEILKQRYARGEIDTAELQERTNQLRTKK